MFHADKVIQFRLLVKNDCRSSSDEAVKILLPFVTTYLRDTGFSAFTVMKTKYRSWFIIRGCIQKFQDWPPGARTANGTALCHYMQLCRYFASQSSEFCRNNPLCCFSALFVVIVIVYFVMTQSGKLRIHPRRKELRVAISSVRPQFGKLCTEKKSYPSH
jgi:hypothetical protein